MYCFLWQVLLRPLVDPGWLPCSELTCISTMMTIVCFQGLSDRHDKLALLSIVFALFAYMPVLLPAAVDNYSVLSFLLGSGWGWDILPFASLRFSLPSLAYLGICGILAQMAFTAGSLKGAAQVLVPHFVCLMWWEITMLFFKSASWTGMLRGSLGWGLLVVLSPMLLVLLVGWLGFYIISMMTFSTLLKVLTTLFVLALPVVLGFWAKSGFKVNSLT